MAAGVDYTATTLIQKTADSFAAVLDELASETSDMRRERSWKTLMASQGVGRSFAHGLFTTGRGVSYVTGPSPISADGTAMLLSSKGHEDDMMEWTAKDLAQQEGLSYTKHAFTALTLEALVKLDWTEGKEIPAGSFSFMGSTVHTVPHVVGDGPSAPLSKF